LTLPPLPHSSAHRRGTYPQPDPARRRLADDPATGITNYLEHAGTLEKAQQMAAHSSPRTTKLYDRTNDQITLDEVEKIQL
jgi:hypothetical protein